MKRGYVKIMMMACLAFGLVSVATAQFDDIYFDPDNADDLYAEVELKKYIDQSTYEATDAPDDRYDYYYTSRMRRFDNPYYGFDFYSPAYVDPSYYNPYYSNFYRPGSSIYWGGAAVPVNRPQTFVSTGWGYSTFAGGAPIVGVNAWGQPVNAWGQTVNTFPGSVNSFGGGAFVGRAPGAGGFAGGGINAYCPPSAYGNPSIGTFNPGPGTVFNGNVNPNPRGVTSTGTVYGPRGSAGTVTTSPRNNRGGGSVSAPDRPLTTAGNATSPRSARQAYTGNNSRTRATSASPRSSRQAYTPPRNSATRSFDRTSSAASRFNSSSSTRPARPSSSTYRPASDYSRSSFNRSSSSSSSRSSFRSSGSSSRSSFSSGRSSSGGSRSGGSPRGGRG